MLHLKCKIEPDETLAFFFKKKTYLAINKMQKSTNCLGAFDQFVGLALKELKNHLPKLRS